MPEIYRIQLTGHDLALVHELLDKLQDNLTESRCGIVLAGDTGLLIADDVIEMEEIELLDYTQTISHIGNYDEVQRRVYPDREVYSLDDELGVQVSLEEE